MMKIAKLEEVVLKALEKSGTEVSVADIIRRAQLTMTKGNVSSRLCELRTKGYATSYQQDGVNYWSLTQAGLAVLNGDIPADMSPPEVAQESLENQPIDGDISADMVPASLDVLASEVLQGKSSIAFEMLAKAEPELDWTPEPECPDPGLPNPLQYDPDSIQINPALVEESHQVRPVWRFPNLNDALFVLDTINMAYCRDLPAYQEELSRIADHLKATAA